MAKKLNYNLYLGENPNPKDTNNIVVQGTVENGKLTSIESLKLNGKDLVFDLTTYTIKTVDATVTDSPVVENPVKTATENTSGKFEDYDYMVPHFGDLFIGTDNRILEVLNNIIDNYLPENSTAIVCITNTANHTYKMEVYKDSESLVTLQELEGFEEGNYTEIYLYVFEPLTWETPLYFTV